jgi:hypothetical protein
MRVLRLEQMREVSLQSQCKHAEIVTFSTTFRILKRRLRQTAKQWCTSLPPNLQASDHQHCFAVSLHGDCSCRPLFPLPTMSTLWLLLFAVALLMSCGALPMRYSSIALALS